MSNPLARLTPSQAVRLIRLAKQADPEVLRRENPLTYGHRPHAMQERILACKARRRLVVAANRGGKTEGAMRDVLWSARGQHPYRKVKLHNQIWVGAPDYPSYTKFTKPTFDAWCPPGWIEGEFHESEKWVRIRRIDGGICTIFFLSYDMPRSKWQGAGVDGVWLDEEMPEDIVKECLARIVTTKGWIMLTFTPIEGMGWWYDRLWVPAKAGKSTWVPFEMPLATRRPELEADFEVGEPLVPHLTREQIIEFASEYPDPDERAIRVFGAVTSRRGLVYKGFRTDVHVIPAFPLPAHYDIWGAVDPGYHGFAVTLAAFSPAGRTFVARELFSQQETTRTRFRALLERVRAMRQPGEWTPENSTVVLFVDTEDPQVVLELNVQAAEAAEEEAREHASDANFLPISVAFASLEMGLKARKAGFLRVQQVLQPSADRPTPELVARPRPAQGEPLLYFFDDLYSEWRGEDEYMRESRVLWEIERYAWKKPSKAAPTIRPDDADENSAAGAHAMATLRYLIMARLGPPEEPEEDQRSHLPQHAQEIWEDMEELEHRQLAAAGLL